MERGGTDPFCQYGTLKRADAGKAKVRASQLRRHANDKIKRDAAPENLTDILKKTIPNAKKKEGLRCDIERRGIPTNGRRPESARFSNRKS